MRPAFSHLSERSEEAIFPPKNESVWFLLFIVRLMNPFFIICNKIFPGSLLHYFPSICAGVRWLQADGALLSNHCKYWCNYSTIRTSASAITPASQGLITFELFDKDGMSLPVLLWTDLHKIQTCGNHSRPTPYRNGLEIMSLIPFDVVSPTSSHTKTLGRKYFRTLWALLK